LTVVTLSCTRVLPARLLTPTDPHLAAIYRDASGAVDGARTVAGQRGEETVEQVRERLGRSARRALANPRAPAQLADSERDRPSGAVGTSSSVVYSPANDKGSGSARATDQARERDSRNPAEPEPTPRPIAARWAFAIWTSTAIIAAFVCWTAVTVLAHGRRKVNNVRD
jgi:hypothetical protein